MLTMLMSCLSIQEQSVYKAEAKVSSVPSGKLLCKLQAVAPCAVACNSKCIIIGEFPLPLSFSFSGLAQLLRIITLYNHVITGSICPQGSSAGIVFTH